MTQKKDNAKEKEQDWKAIFVEALQEEDDAFRRLLERIVQDVLQGEMDETLGAEKSERTGNRQGYRSGYYPRTLITRVGKLELRVPQDRQGRFRTEVFERYQRSEKALVGSLAEMYVQGVSTRKVKEITEQLCGHEFSAATVSRMNQTLDEELAKFASRRLEEEYPYVVLDARYEKVRVDGQVRDVAVLIATGVEHSGKRRVLGVSVSLSEAEVHWREFLSGLVARGLRGVRLITSDAHEGLAAARRAVFGGVPWQRCQFHLQQNAQAYVPRAELKAEVAGDIRAIFTAPDKAEAVARLERTVSKYRPLASKLAAWLEDNLPEGFAVFGLPEGHRRLLRTTNGLERVNQELKRRTRVVGIFPNEASCLRLVSALLMETSEEWEAGRAYLTFD